MVQLEIGVQTFDGDVSKRIQRPQNNTKVENNLSFLRQNTEMYLHVDLIVGLPGESATSFGAGFDRLLALNPHEIQVGVLKRLKGTPIVQHDLPFEMLYSPLAPFEILSTSTLSFEEVQGLKRFARYWEMVANRGQFLGSAPLIWEGQPSAFVAFLAFSEWLFERVGRTTQINLLRLAEHLFVYLTEHRDLDEQSVGTSLVADLHRVGGRSIPGALQRFEVSPPPSRVHSAKNKGHERQDRRRQTP
jgi:hypothetical protein